MSKLSAKMLTSSEISSFCAQMAMIMKSGISIQEGVSILYEDADHPDVKEILKVITDHVDVGEPLHMALEASHQFPKYVLDMVEIGEHSGKLEEVLDSLCDYYEREENMSQSIRNAVTYPLVMVVLMLLVVGVLVVKVLPIFNEVFLQLGGEMSGFARGIMNFGSVFGKYSIIILAVVALIVCGILFAKNTEKGKRVIKRWGESFFATKKMAAKIASGRFASALSLMLSSGVDTDNALDMVEKLVDNQDIHKKIITCREAISVGESFSDALANAEIFTGMDARMLSIGFKTGSTDSVMKKIADRYESEIEIRVNNAISVLEPTMVAILAVVVGMILLSVMMPLMGIMSTIG